MGASLLTTTWASWLFPINRRPLRLQGGVESPLAEIKPATKKDLQTLPPGQFPAAGHFTMRRWQVANRQGLIFRLIFGQGHIMPWQICWCHF